MSEPTGSTGQAQNRTAHCTVKHGAGTLELSFIVRSGF